MRLQPEMTPKYQKEITYEDRLLDLEFGEYTMISREDIDNFFAGLYFARLTNEQRARMSNEDITIIDYTLHPSDYDTTAQSVGVVIIPSVEHAQQLGKLQPGEAVHVTIDTEGNVIGDDNKEATQYSASMIPFVQDLYEEVKSNYESLDEGLVNLT